MRKAALSSATTTSRQRSYDTEKTAFPVFIPPLHPLNQQSACEISRLGPVQCSFRDEKIVPLQIAFLRNVLAIIEAAGKLIPAVGPECEFQSLLFRHENESL